MGSESRLQIGEGLALPADYVTQTGAILGKRGVGKTHLAGVIAEEMLEHRLPVVVLDPIGVWWGLRSSADGKRTGYELLVLGGDHGDLPLEAGAGRLVADFVVAKAASAVLDLARFSKGDQERFVTDFLERIYAANRRPLHLVLDEADAFAPQKIKGRERCFGAVDTVVRRGRARGLGVTLATQRSAVLNKDVLSQAETLFAFRTLAPQDRAAVEAWVEVHGDERTTRDVMGSLHELKVGECWVWSPAWLEILKRVRIRPRRTFDSSATPAVGARAAAPRAIAAVDVEALRGELASLVQKAEQEDPRRLRARIGELERELARKPVAAPTPASAPRRVEVPVVPAKALRAIEVLADRVLAHGQRVEEWTRQVVAVREQVRAIVERTTPATAERRALGEEIGAALAERPARGVGAVLAQPGPVVARTVVSANGQVHLDAGERAVLTAIAQEADAGCSREQISVLTGYKRSSRDTYLQKLAQQGLISRAEGDGQRFRATAAGVAALGSGFEPLPTGDALREHWRQRLPEGERRCLDVVVDAYPGEVPVEAVSERTGYKRSSRDTYLQKLAARRLVSRDRGRVRAADQLFGGGLAR